MKIIKTSESGSDNIVKQAVAILRAGGLILFPTETTYGAGVDATNPAAVEKLLAYKSRREGKPLSIAVTDKNMASEYVVLNESAHKLYDRFLPGPVTVVSQGRGVVAPGVESEFGTLGVRIPAYELVLQIVEALGKPLTATSANGSGNKRPYSIDDALSQLSDKQKSLIDVIIDAGTLPTNPPSTVIDTTLSTPVTMRQGAVTNEAQTGAITTLISHSEAETKAIAGKIMLKNWDVIKNNGLVIGLDGSLGVGKTIFTKGVAEFLQIKDTLSSPTYTYIQEYDFTRHGFTGRLFHLDVWKIDSPEMFERLAFNELLGAGKIVVVEWWQQIASLLPNLPVIEVVIKDTGSQQRQIVTKEL
jgi:L-threonylcarbamoyladenylate synthase